MEKTRKVTWIVTVGLVVYVLLVVAGFIHFSKTDDEGIHYHAAFRLYVDDQLVDFSGPQFMHDEPCSIDEPEAATAESDLQERAHLHNANGEMVHVHRPDVVWANLFENLGYGFDRPVVGLVDDQAVDSILTQPITSYEQVLFFVGTTTDVAGKAAAMPTVDDIKRVEQLTLENCGLT